MELSQQFDMHANQVKQSTGQLLDGATGVFGDEARAEPAGGANAENDFFAGALGKAGLLRGFMSPRCLRASATNTPHFLLRLRSRDKLLHR